MLIFEFSKEVELDEELTIQDDDSGDENASQATSAGQKPAEHEEDEDGQDSLFPDTSIDLQLTREGK